MKDSSRRYYNIGAFICIIILQFSIEGYRYKTCCGKTICSGCSYAPVYDNQGNEVDNEKCPFCRAGHYYVDEEFVQIERVKRRAEMNDPIAINNQGNYYRDGIHGFPQDMNKALEMFHKAGVLGFAEAYNIIGSVYYNGEGVQQDEKKATHYFEQAAMEGSVQKLGTILVFTRKR